MATVPSESVLPLASKLTAVLGVGLEGVKVNEAVGAISAKTLAPE